MKKSKQTEQEAAQVNEQQALVPMSEYNRQFEYWNVIRGALAKKPDTNEVKTNKFANNSKFISIGTIESKLDMIFNGAWKTHTFETKVVANEIIGSIVLEVLLPQIGWITRIGAGAVQIQMEKGSDITDITSKIKNTLQKDYPHLKAECIKNACKSLGTAFGRDLNREDSVDFGVIYTESELLKRAKEDVLERLTLEVYSEPEVYKHNAMSIYKNYESQMTDVEKRDLHKFMTEHKTNLKTEYETKLS